MKVSRYISTLLALALGQTAFAATYNFGSLGSVSSTGYSQTVDGITVTVTAPGNKLAYYTVAGVNGIGNSGCVFGICSAGIQQNETLVVSFSQAVTVTGITFAAWDGPDTAVLVSAPGGNVLTLDNDPTIGQVDSFNLPAFGELNSFTIKDTSFTGLFTLRGLQVQPVAVTPAVPIPAAAWLFGSGLLGLAGFSRRRGK